MLCEYILDATAVIPKAGGRLIALGSRLHLEIWELYHFRQLGISYQQSP